jgi:hypothetical protein
MVMAFLARPAAAEDREIHSTPHPDQVEILGEIQQYYRDFSDRDWEAFGGHFWEGATITTVWQPPGEEKSSVVVTTVPEFVAKAPEGPGSKPIFEETMGGAEVLVYQNLAMVWAEYSAKFGEPGEIHEWYGIDAFTLMNHEGRWKIVSLAFSAEE